MVNKTKQELKKKERLKKEMVCICKLATRYIGVNDVCRWPRNVAMLW